MQTERKAKTVICNEGWIFLSQFFQSLRYFSSHPKERSTIQRLGRTWNVCGSLRFTTYLYSGFAECFHSIGEFFAGITAIVAFFLCGIHILYVFGVYDAKGGIVFLSASLRSMCVNFF